MDGGRASRGEVGGTGGGAASRVGGEEGGRTGGGAAKGEAGGTGGGAERRAGGTGSGASRDEAGGWLRRRQSGNEGGGGAATGGRAGAGQSGNEAKRSPAAAGRPVILGRLGLDYWSELWPAGLSCFLLLLRSVHILRRGLLCIAPKRLVPIPSPATRK